jgi:hypothetical protein
MVKCHENAASSTRAQHFPTPTNRRQDLRIRLLRGRAVAFVLRVARHIEARAPTSDGPRLDWYRVSYSYRWGRWV